MKHWIIITLFLPALALAAPVGSFHSAGIFFVEHSADYEYCRNFGPKIEGCFISETKHIYINNQPSRPKDFILYHELGHYLVGTDFPASLFTDKETMADQFGLFIYNQKFGMLPKVSKERSRFFWKVCDYFCVKEIEQLYVPGAKYVRFYVRM